MCNDLRTNLLRYSPRICGHQGLCNLSINSQKLTQLLNVAQHCVHLLANCDTVRLRVIFTT